MNTSKVCLLLASAFVSSLAAPAFASRPFFIDPSLAGRLEQGIAPGEKLELRDIALIDGNPTTLQLERFEVWGPDPQIIVFEKDGKSFHKLPRPETKFYKGIVNGDPSSMVEISVGTNGRISGVIMAGDRMFTVGRGERHGKGVRPVHIDDDETAVDRAAPLMIREFDDFDDLIANPGAGDWKCNSDAVSVRHVRKAVSDGVASSVAVAPNGTPASGVSYSLNLAVETDGELRAAFGSDSALTTYLGDLIAKASVIYQRDLSTTLTIGTTHIWSSSATDPWTVTTASTTPAALAELGNYWHANYSGVVRSSVVFLSGKNFGGGVGWEDVLCGADFQCDATGSNCGASEYANAWGGAYAFCGSFGGVSVTNPDPTATVNGVLYGLPTSNFWPLLEVCHELGHNANGPHTHCVGLTSTQKTTYGVSRNFVDTCFYNEGATCATNGTGGIGTISDVPSEKGTIMSYCHNIFSSGFRQSRYCFYRPNEAAEVVLGNSVAKCEAGLDPNALSSSSCYFNAGLNQGTTGLDATITIGSNLTCSAGKTASVPVNASATFAWQIVGGNITAGATTRQITFTPTAASVTVTVTVTNANGCGITNTATTSTQCGALTAPTGLVATATGTSIAVSWNSVAAATSYHVYRSTTGSFTTFTNVVGTSFPDTGAADTAYLYMVRAFNGSTESGDSNKDLAETTVFTSITPLSTKVLASNITSLRTAVDKVRQLANGGVANPASYTDPSLATGTGGTKIKAIHITQLRTFLDTARGTLGVGPGTYSDTTLNTGAGGTKVKAQHILDLRAAVQ